MPLAARDFGAVQAAADLDFDSLRSEAQRFFHGFAHRATKSNSFLELRGDLLCLQLGVQFGLVNLLNRNQDLAPGSRSNVAFELIDLGSLAADDDARPRRVDDDLQAIGRALDVDVRNARAGETFLQLALQPQIFNQKIAVLLFREPVGMPVLVIAKAKTVWMNFLAQSLLLFCLLLTSERAAKLR